MSDASESKSQSKKSDEPRAGRVELVTHAVVRELANGAAMAAPVADPTIVAYGERGAIQASGSLLTYLRGWLPEQRAAVVARFSTPAGVELVEVPVTLPLPEGTLPRRLDQAPVIGIPCTVVPLGPSRWVNALPFDQTIHVAEDEDLYEVVAAEFRRLASAQALSGLEYLRVLPTGPCQLTEILVPIDKSDLVAAQLSGRTADLKKKLRQRAEKKHAIEILDAIGTPLHTRLTLRPEPEVVHRRRELDLLEPLLGSDARLGVMLVGEQLVGKSALFRTWVTRQLKPGGPRRPVYATSGARLIAGMSGLGQWEERLRRVLAAVETLDAVLYFDNLADLFARAGSKDGVDMAGFIKPWLDERRVRVVGEVRPETLDLVRHRHAGFLGALSTLHVEPLEAEQAVDAIDRTRRWSEQHEPHRPTLEEAAVRPLVDLAERYQPYLPFPGKAARLAEELRAFYEHERDPMGGPRKIGPSEVYQGFALTSGIPELLLHPDRALLAEDVRRALTKRVIGQDEAIRRVVDTICVIKAGLQPEGRPLATLLFAGPTGVGKTEVARTLANYLFGSPERMVRFDMSEFMDGHAAQRLIAGTERSEGLLVRRVRQQPFCVLLLDEIEKAHPAVFDLLLQVLGEGRLTDVRGRTASFANAIIIMTSNLGATSSRRVAGLAPRGSESTDDGAAEHYRAQVLRAFRPEFVNRLDQVVAFAPLTPEEIRAVTRIAIRSLANRRGLTELGLELATSDEALDHLAEHGYSAAYGARALRRHLEDSLAGPIARQLAAAGKEARAGRIEVGLEAGPTGEPALKVTLVKASQKRARQDLRGAAGVSEVRRGIYASLALEQVDDTRERVKLLVAQLAQAQRSAAKKKRGLSGKELSSLHAELGRLQPLIERSEVDRGEIDALEELAIQTLYDDEDTSELMAEALEIERRFRYVLLELLLAGVDERLLDRGTVMVGEIDDRRALDFWLPGLVEAAKARKWQLGFHLDRDREPLPPDSEWDDDLRWGPARSGAWIAKRAAADKRKKMRLVIEARGHRAGVLLALSAGLLRFVGGKAGGSDDPAHLEVIHLARRAPLLDTQWSLEQLTAPSFLSPDNAKKLTPTFTIKLGAKTIELTDEGESTDVPPEALWSRIEEIALVRLMRLYHSAEDEDLLRGTLDGVKAS